MLKPLAFNFFKASSQTDLIQARLLALRGLSTGAPRPLRIDSDALGQPSFDFNSDAEALFWVFLAASFDDLEFIWLLSFPAV